MHWNPASFWTVRKVKAGVFRLTWLSLTSLWNTHHMGKMKASLVCAFMCVRICSVKWSQLKSVDVVGCMSFFFSVENMLSLLLLTSVNPPELPDLCRYGLGSLVMTAFTHNVCALFCKSMVVDVCLLLYFTINHILDIPCLSLWAPALLLDQFPLAKKRRK